VCPAEGAVSNRPSVPFRRQKKTEGRTEGFDPLDNLNFQYNEKSDGLPRSPVKSVSCEFLSTI